MVAYISARGGNFCNRLGLDDISIFPHNPSCRLFNYLSVTTISLSLVLTCHVVFISFPLTLHREK